MICKQIYLPLFRFFFLTLSQNQSIIKRVRKIVRWFIAFVVGGYLGLLLLFSYTPIRTLVHSHINQELQRLFETDCSIQAIQLGLFNRIIIDRLSIYDQTHTEMLSCEKVAVKLNLLPLFKGNISIHNIELIDLKVNLSKKTPDTPYNFQFILDKLGNDKPADTQTDWQIRTLIIRNAQISHTVVYQPDTLKQIDVNHLKIEKLNANLSIMALRDDSINVRVRSFQMKERSGLTINQFQTRIIANRTLCAISASKLELPNSRLEIAPCRFRFKHGLFLQTVHGNIALKNSHFDLADFNFLTPTLNEHTSQKYSLESSINISNQKAHLQSSKIIGLDNDFRLYATATVNWNTHQDKTILYGDVNIDDLQIPSKLVTFWGTRSTLFAESVTPILSSIGNIHYSGRFDLSPSRNLTSSHLLQTEVGHLRATAGITPDTTIHIQFQECDIDLKKIGIAQAGHILFKGELEQTTKQTQGNLQIDKLEYNDYVYQNMTINVTKQQNIYRYNAKIQDEHLLADLEGSFQEQQKTPSLHVILNLDKADPNTLKWSDAYGDTEFSSTITARFSGNEIDNLNGSLGIYNLSMKKAGNTVYALDSLTCLASSYKRQKKLQLKSNFINATIDGNFAYKELPSCLRSIVVEELPHLFAKNSPKIPPHQNKITFQCSLYHTDFLNHVLQIPLNTDGKPINISGYMDHKDKQLLVEGVFPHFTYNQELYTAGKLFVKRDTGKIHFLAQVTKRMQESDIKLALQSNISNNLIDTELQWKENQTGIHKGNILLTSKIDLDPVKTSIISTHIHPTDIYINDSIWKLSPSTAIYHDGHFYIRNFRIAHKNQELTINGNLEPNARDSISASLQAINLEYLFDLLNFHPVDFTGLATGSLQLSNTLQSPHVRANLQVKDFTFNTGLMGDMNLIGGWNKEENKISLDADIRELDKSRTQVNGYVSIKESALDLNIQSQQTNLAFLNSFLSDIMSDIKGRTNGHCRLYGPFSHLNIEGEHIASLQTRLNILNTDYTLKNDSVILKPGHIEIRNATLFDTEGNTGKLMASIRHEHFDNFNYDIRLNPLKMLTYNYPHPDEGSTFYGKIYGTGTIHLTGKPGMLNVDATINPNDKSTFTYNADRPDDADQLQLLNITNGNHEKSNDSDSAIVETSQSATLQPTTDIYVNLNLDINPSTAIRIVMNEKTGDDIQCNGNGIIRASFYNKGKFQLFGTYTINEGRYKMSLQDIIRKEFSLQQDGTITFGGDPGLGDLSLQAIYTVNSASLSDLNIGNNFSGNPTKVNCILNFSGKVEEPKVSFDLDLPNVNADEKQMVRNLISTEEDMNMQIIYLLSIGRFYTYDYSQTSYATSQSQSSVAMKSLLSSTLSSQLNSMLSSVLNNKHWSFGTNFSTGNVGWSDMEVEGLLSGRLLNNRLLINGNFGYRDNPTYSTNFIGDFNIQWLLNRSGNIRLKAYSEINDRYFTTSTLSTQGGGIVFKRDFNTIRDLFRPKKKHKEEKEKPRGDLP